MAQVPNTGPGCFWWRSLIELKRQFYDVPGSWGVARGRRGRSGGAARPKRLSPVADAAQAAGSQAVLRTSCCGYRRTLWLLWWWWVDLSRRWVVSWCAAWRAAGKVADRAAALQQLSAGGGRRPARSSVLGIQIFHARRGVAYAGSAEAGYGWRGSALPGSSGREKIIARVGVW